MVDPKLGAEVPSSPPCAVHQGPQILFKSALMQRLWEKLRRAAAGDATVLITGETGTGKDLIALALHHLSRRMQAPFVCVDCAALVGTLLEGELYGHRKGVFTGAIADKMGLAEAAHGGTLFLNEVGDATQDLQKRLLDLIQNRRCRRIGDLAHKSFDLRFIAATNRDLGALVVTGEFRRDLFHRLKVVEIEVPALRFRAEDIPLLAGAFLGRFSGQYGRKMRPFAPDILRQFMDYSWPGNVRELENSIESLVVSSESEFIEFGAVQAHLERSRETLGPAPSPPQADPNSDREYRETHEALKAHRGDVDQVAGALGIDRSSVYRRIKRFKLDIRQYRHRSDS